MALKIQIKNSTTTKVIPDAAVDQGELAYSFVTGDSDGGDRLGIGNAAGGVDIIGGKYFTDMLDHPEGTVKPSSVIITDANSKIDILKVDDLTLDASQISNTSGDITISPTGNLSLNSNKITNVTDPASAQDAATKNYIDTKVIATASGDTNPSGTGQIVTGENIFIKGGWGVNTTRIDLAGGPQISIDLDSAQGTFEVLSVDNIKLDGNTVGTTSGDLTLDPAAIGDNTGTVIIAGNLQVDGTTTTLNSTTLTIDDKNIVLASGAANPAAADGAGITIDGADATMLYAQSTDTFNFNKKISAPNIDINGAGSFTTLTGKYLGFDSDLQATTTSRLPEGTNLYYTTARADSAFDASFAAASTDSLSEGSTNLYFTDARARAAISATNVSGDGSVAYNNSTGVLSYTGPSAAETRAHFSAGGDLTYNSGTGQFSVDVETIYTKANFDSDLGLANTGQLPEGSNLYFTDERVDDRVAALLSAAEGLDAAYNDGTGVLTLSAEIATQTNKGVAAFDSVDFIVTSGQVEIRTIDCGTF